MTIVMPFEFTFHMLPLVGCYLQVDAGRLQSDPTFLSPYRNLEHRSRARHHPCHFSPHTKTQPYFNDTGVEKF